MTTEYHLSREVGVVGPYLWDHSPPRTVTPLRLASRRNASYWNAALFDLKIKVTVQWLNYVTHFKVTPIFDFKTH